MRKLRALYVRLGELFQKGRREREFADELESHIQMHIEDNLQSGMSPEQARREALIKLGGIEPTKEHYRDQSGFPFFEALLQDARFGARLLRKSPGFTAVAILTLALGIGANTAIFSAINGLLLHPVGVTDPSRLVVIQEKYDKLNLKAIPLSAPNFADVRDSREVFSFAAAQFQSSFNYTSGDVSERLVGAHVSSEWFDVFGAKPLLGRVFRPEEEQPDMNHEVVLAYSTWKRMFGGDATIIGKTLELNQMPYQVLGVMGPDFAWPNWAQLWVPLGLPPSQFAAANRFNENLTVVARMRTGVSLGQAKTFVLLLAQRIIEGDPDGKELATIGWGMFASPLTDWAFGDFRAPMLILLGAVGFVLLIACTNITGLMLARASTRAREFTLRTALGSTRWRLIRQMLVESLLLAGAGTLLGSLLAKGGIAILLRLAPQEIVAGVTIRTDVYVLGFTALIGILSATLFGIAPAWQSSGNQKYELLKEGGRSATAGRNRLRLRSLLVVSEVALALMLLVGAGLFLKSFARIQQVNPGFDAHGVMTSAVSLSETRYETPQKQMAFYEAVVDQLAQKPGVTVAGAALPLPFTGSEESSAFDIENRSVGPGNPIAPHSDLAWVTPGYFGAMNIPLREGRTFTEQDREGTQAVVVIDENLAKQYWPNESPIGRRLEPYRAKNPSWATIIGVVGHVDRAALVGDNQKGLRYYPTYQQILPGPYFLVAKTSANPAALAAAMREAVRAVDPSQPVYDQQSMDERVGASLGTRRLVVLFLSFFSVVAAVMSGLGLYGMISYSVNQRTQEIGIRVALGANRRQVLSLVLGNGIRLTCIGILIGLLGALALARLVASQLFETSVFDPLTFGVMSLVLTVIALAASYIPARRAMKVDPMVALRHE